MEPVHKKFTDLLMTKRLQTLQSVDDAIEKVCSLFLIQWVHIILLRDFFLPFLLEHTYLAIYICMDE